MPLCRDLGSIVLVLQTVQSRFKKETVAAPEHNQPSADGQVFLHGGCNFHSIGFRICIALDNGQSMRRLLVHAHKSTRLRVANILQLSEPFLESYAPRTAYGAVERH